jgi:hypothetical protein
MEKCLYSVWFYNFLLYYLFAYSRAIKASKNNGEVLVFRRGPMPPAVKTENPAAREVGIEAQE